MPEILQKGSKPTTPVTMKDTIDFYTSGGKTGAAKNAIRSRSGQLDAQEDRDVNGHSPTDVEYGGNKGSSTRNPDGSTR